MTATNHNEFDLRDAIGYLVGRASRALGMKLNRAFADHGYDITLDHWIIMNTSYCEGGKAQHEFVTITGRDKTAITRLIDDMETRNIVVRVPDQLDRRTKRVHLTHKGKELQMELLPIVWQVNQEAEKDIDQKDMKTCKKVLEELYQNAQSTNELK